MRWTAEKERTLWRIVMETQNLTLDIDQVAGAWAGDDKPTAEMIKTHLLKSCDNIAPNKSLILFTDGKRFTATGGTTDSDRKEHTPRKTQVVHVLESPIKNEGPLRKKVKVEDVESVGVPELSDSLTIADEDTNPLEISLRNCYGEGCGNLECASCFGGLCEDDFRL